MQRSAGNHGSCSHQNKHPVQVDEYNYAIISSYVNLTIYIFIVTEKPCLENINKVCIVLYSMQPQGGSLKKATFLVQHSWVSLSHFYLQVTVNITTDAAILAWGNH